MAGLEIGHLGLVASLDQSVETSVDELADAAAQDSLLAEQVGLGLLLEGGLEDAGRPAPMPEAYARVDVLALPVKSALDTDQRG